MNRQSMWMVSLVCLFVGFMVAVQFQTTTAKPEVRDTRDEWEVRKALKEQQDIQQELLEKLSAVDKTIESYEKNSSKDQVDTLKNSIEKLEDKVGLTEKKGDGVEVTISPIFLENFSGEQEYPSLSPQMLSRLINELNTFGATDIAVGNERVTSLSPIRNVNGSTYVNNRPLPPLPVSIRVLADNADKLKDYINTSQSKDIFSIENLDMIAELKEDITLPKYDDPLHLEKLEEIGE